MSTTHARSLERVVDVARYPLGEPDGPAWRHVVARIRHELRRDGCSVLAGFVRPEHHAELRRQGADIAPAAYDDVEIVNVYNTAADADADLADDHPGRIRMARGNAFVPRDAVPADFLIHRLYTSPALRRFLAACVGLPAIHELADPLAGLCLNVIAPGREHPWHFDTNEFSVSLLTQEAEAGGVFEYCPAIRAPGAENLADVRGVLTGRRPDLVRRLTLRPGDLQLFAGRFSLHRVTEVAGTRARHSAILAYSERSGVVGTVARTRQLFGRVTPAHLAATGAARRGDRLLD